MSGQLVGEVLDAAETLQARGLSERGFYALIAIAEKCHHITRQGSVPLSHIRAGLYGASKRTAERALQDAKRVGVLRVVKRGFNNNHGRVCAPIYEIQPLTVPATQVAQSPPDRSRQNDDRSRHIDDRSRHPGGVLNGSTNGSINGGARASADAPTPPPIKNPEEEPPRYCPKHMPNGTDQRCRPCGTARVARDAWKEAENARRAAAEKAEREAYRRCPNNCDNNRYYYDENDRYVSCNHQPKGVA